MSATWRRVSSGMTAPKASAGDVTQVAGLCRIRQVLAHGAELRREVRALLDNALEALPLGLAERRGERVDVVQLRPALELGPGEDEGAERAEVGQAGRLVLQGSKPLAGLRL